jgi:hypothetical protein
MIAALQLTYSPLTDSQLTLKLPTRFSDTRDQTITGQVAKTNPANTEFAISGSGPPANATAKANANSVPRAQFVLGGIFFVPLQNLQLTPVFN